MRGRRIGFEGFGVGGLVHFLVGSLGTGSGMKDVVLKPWAWDMKRRIHDVLRRNAQPGCFALETHLSLWQIGAHTSAARIRKSRKR